MWPLFARGLLWAFAGIQGYQFAQPILAFFGLARRADQDELEPPSITSLVLLLLGIILVFGFVYLVLKATGMFGQQRDASG